MHKTDSRKYKYPAILNIHAPAGIHMNVTMGEQCLSVFIYQ
jgi:hypothetical protein